jgi:hypothetical protein
MSTAPASGLGAPARHSLTVDEIMSDPLTEIAAKYWAVVRRFPNETAWCRVAPTLVVSIFTGFWIRWHAVDLHVGYPMFVCMGLWRYLG